MRRIDIILNRKNHLTYSGYCATKIRESLEEEGMEVFTLFLEEGRFIEYLKAAKKKPPKGIVTFAAEKIPDHYNLNNCPELSLVQSQVNHFVSSTQKKKIGIADRTYAEQVKGFFFPQPFEQKDFFSLKNLRPLKIAAFIDLVDVDYLKGAWERTLPLPIIEVLTNLLCFFQAHPEIHPLQSKVALPEGMTPFAILSMVTPYLKALIERPLIEAFIDLPLHLFGNHVGQDLYVRLPNADSLYLHALPPFAPLLSLLEEIEILVIKQLPYIDGPSEFFFPALQKGTLPLINPSFFLIELFGKDSPLFYHSHEELIQKCHFFLHHPEKRVALIEELRSIDLKPYSWKRVAHFFT